MKKIILDTNFLLTPTIFNIDIFAEIDRILDFPHKVCIIDRTMHELENIKKKPKFRKAAEIALELIKAKDLLIISQNQDSIVDDIIVDIADNDTIVATQDQDLKKRLLKKNIPVIILRQKRYLELIDNVL